MSVEVFIKIIAMDHKAGIKKTETRTVEVPQAVLRITEMFSKKGSAALVTTIAKSVMLGALKELDASRKNTRVALDEVVSRTGRVGGSSATGKVDPLGEALGLDVIQAMNGGGARRAPQAPQAPQPGMPPQPTVPMMPAPVPMGPAEFGGGGPGQQMGPGVSGFPAAGTPGARR